jgi:hypothetical protein
MSPLSALRGEGGERSRDSTVATHWVHLAPARGRILYERVPFYSRQKSGSKAN